MSIFSKIEQGFEDFWAEHIKPFLHDEVEPILKAFVKQFDNQFGHDAIIAAMAAIGKLEAGEKFGDIAASLVKTLVQDAAQDTAQAFKTVQAALQVAKTTTDTTSPSDKNNIANLSTPQ